MPRPLAFLLCSVGLLCACALLLFALVAFFLDQPLPAGREGPDAEQLRAKIERAAGLDAWNKTAALSFFFPLSSTRHFRDNFRAYREVVWEEGKVTYAVQYDQHANFLAVADGKRVSHDAGWKLYEEADKRHTNDFFWLHPFSQMRAPGAKVLFVGKRALLLQYESGGYTPGDSYLFVVNEDSFPIRWQLWASVLPWDGIEFSFEEWHTCSTGARFSLRHKHTLFDVPIRDLKCYAHYPIAKTGEKDRFAAFHRYLQAAKP